MKRRFKRQLKEDELVSTVNKVIDFFKRKKKVVAAVCILIVAVIIVYLGMRLMKTSQTKKGSETLSRIFEISAQLKDNPDKIEELESLASKGKFRRVAYIQLASFWAGQEEYEKAEAEIMKMPEKKKDVFYYKAKDLLGQIYIKQKKFDEAVSLYDQLSDNPHDYTRDVLLFHKAQALEEKGELEKALEVYKTIQEEFSQTYYGYEASQKVVELEGKERE